ncbi:MAG: DUF3131 domain-containing protein [Crenarchaeota archaeon]|nr:DUF3131 domain-containing protein [Thermoproteota archaeon]
MSKKYKVSISLALIVLLIVSVFAFLPREGNTTEPTDEKPPSIDGTPQPTNTPPPTNNPTVNPTVSPTIEDPDDGTSITPKAPGLFESAKVIDSALWQKVAEKAWNYYKPGVGVDKNTGLPWTSTVVPYFTDWDLGVYIQALIDASKLGLIGKDREWGFNDRVVKVLTFLETRELNNASYPFWFYHASDGEVWTEKSDVADFYVDVADTGRLLVALDNLRKYSSAFSSRINNFVYNTYNNRSDYSILVPTLKTECETSTNIYTYYIVSGFAAFWSSELSGAASKVIRNMYSAGNVTTYGVTLPKGKITSDILLCCLFELNNVDPILKDLTYQVYTAHESYCNTTYSHRAFGEGPTFTTDWQWEWVVLPDGQTWMVHNGSNEIVSDFPMVYFKVGIGFLSVYNTQFARGLVCHIERFLPDFANGFCEGIDEGNYPLTLVGSLTNGLILGSALFFIKNNP